MHKDQNTLAIRQFGPRAAAYVSSATHSGGEDLERLAAVAKERRPSRALDLGCGGGHAAFTVAPHVNEVVAFDLSDDMLEAVTDEAARRGLLNVATRRGAVETLPFGPAEFDMVITRFSMHHWSDLTSGLQEARRVVKNGATGIFIDTVSPGIPALDTVLQAFELFRDPSHVRNYSEPEMHAALNCAGFAVTDIMRRRLHIAFDSWIERMNTPAIQAEAIRAVQRQLSSGVKEFFRISDDGSFELDVSMFETRAE